MFDEHEIASVERETQLKYSGGGGAGYSVETVSALPDARSTAYFDRLLNFKFDLVRKHAPRARVLDLGCATAEHLLALSGRFASGIGADFSLPFLRRARKQAAARAVAGVAFVSANARQLPFQAGAFDFAYSFSTLYYMPDIGQVIHEIARVLRSGGKCVLELGNLYSLNTLVTRAYPELAQPCHVPVSVMERHFREAGLAVLENHAFQILPLWGDRPRWLKPLLSPRWKRLLEKRIGGKMLDQWICGLGRALAFRHLFCLEKRAPPGRAAPRVVSVQQLGEP